eukprot:8828868-Pyramimonas_sp.AAC.1
MVVTGDGHIQAMQKGVCWGITVVPGRVVCPIAAVKYGSAAALNAHAAPCAAVPAGWQSVV